MRILAVIPAYNEEDCIEQTVRSLRAACPHVDYLIVNDGSTDATERICDEQKLNHVSLPINCGLACGFRTGMKYALRHGYDAAVQFDADGQHLPKYIPTMAQALLDHNADIVIASRVLAGESIGGARGVGSRLISLLIKLTGSVSLTDPTSGMRMCMPPVLQATKALRATSSHRHGISTPSFPSRDRGAAATRSSAERQGATTV